MPLPSLDVALTLFGGLDTSLNPTTLPEGLSPANNDIVFKPGGFDSRNGLKRIFAAPFGNNPFPSALWADSYLQASGHYLNLFLDSGAALRKEDVDNAPGVHALQAQLSAATKTFKGVTWEGAYYAAFSDGVHPTDIPRVFDGTNFDRISKDGVGKVDGLMAVADVNSTIVITSVTLAAAVNISTVTSAANGPGGLNLATFTTAAPHGLVLGQAFLVQAAADTRYDGVFQAEAIPSTTTVIVSYAGVLLPNVAAGGTLGPAYATMVTAAPHGMGTGDAFTFTGNAGTLNTGTPGNPTNWVVLSVTNATTFLFGLSNNFGILAGSQATTTGGAGGNLAPGGMIAGGIHQVCVSFLWRGGYITRPSPPIPWTAAGNKQATLTGLPIGPPGVRARIIHLTGAGGGNFFSIPVSVQIPGNSVWFGTAASNTVIAPTVVNDNTTTTVTLDFPDNVLFNGIAADIAGNNLFGIVTLPPCVGFDAYAGRIFAWGMFNTVINFDNMGFNGGVISGSPNSPLSWGNVDAVHGAIVTAPTGFGWGWRITGTGGAGTIGLITQTAYQTPMFISILEPNTQYSYWWYAKPSAAGLAGNLVAELFSGGIAIATASVPINSIPAGGGFVHADFSALTPAAIASDTLLRVYASGQGAGDTVTLCEMMTVFTAQPYVTRSFAVSYINNPETFDGVTGVLGSTQDPMPIMDTFQILESFFYLTGTGKGCLHVTTDAAAEPSSWSVRKRESNVGGASLHCASTSNAWAAWIQDTGKNLALRIFAGGESARISREMKTDFEAANMAAKKTAWLCNADAENKMYMGFAQGEAALPNVMPVLDYFESDTAENIIQNRPLKIGFTGKMLTTDLGRKWTDFTLPMACGCLLARPGGIIQFVCGSGPTAAGQSFGNMYTFDPAKLTDDDYGVIGGTSAKGGPRYMTYFFVNHEMEQTLQLGGSHKLYDAASTFVTGTGKFQFDVHANVMGNVIKRGLDPARPWILTGDIGEDLPWTGLDTNALRVALDFYVTPEAGKTDVQMSFSHASMRLKKHPVSPDTGATKGHA